MNYDNQDGLSLPMSWILLLPHLELYGGVLRVLYLARELKKLGDHVALYVQDGTRNDLVVNELLSRWGIHVSQGDSPRNQVFDVRVVADVNDDSIVWSETFPARRTVLLVIAGGLYYRKKYKSAREQLKPDLAIAVSRSLQEDAPFPTRLIPGGVDSDFLVSERTTSPPERPGTTRIVTHYGRGKAFKGFSSALELCHGLVAQEVNLHLTIISAVPIKEGVPAWAKIAVGLSPAQVANIMRATDVAICLEERPGWSNFSIQALASGCEVWGSGIVAKDFDGVFPRFHNVERSPSLHEFARNVVAVPHSAPSGSELRQLSETVKNLSWDRWCRLVRLAVEEIEELAQTPDRDKMTPPNGGESHG